MKKTFYLSVLSMILGILASPSNLHGQNSLPPVAPPPQGPYIFVAAHTNFNGADISPACYMDPGDNLTAGDYEGMEQLCALFAGNAQITSFKCDQSFHVILTGFCPGGQFPAAKGVPYHMLGSFGLFGAPGDNNNFLDPLDYFLHAGDEFFFDWEFREPRLDGIQTLNVQPFAIAGIVESAFFPLFITPPSQTVILNESVTLEAPTDVIRWVVTPNNVGTITFSDATSITYKAPPSITQSQTITISACDATFFHPDNCGEATLELTPISVTIPTPSQTEILPPNSVQLTAIVNPGFPPAPQGVTWEITEGGEAGTVNPTTGLFTASLFNTSTIVKVKATSTLDPINGQNTIDLSVPVPTITINIPAINNPWFIPTNGLGITPAHITAFVSGVTDSRNTELPLWMSGLTTSPGGIGDFVNILGGPPCFDVSPCSADYEVTLPAPEFAGAQNITVCNNADPAKLFNSVCQVATFSYVPQSSVSPQAISLNPNGQQQFTSIPGVTWSINPNLGSIDQTGLYKAPPPPIDHQTAVNVQACFNTSPNSCGKATVTLLASPDFLLSAPNLIATPGGTVTFTVTVTPLNGFTGTLNIGNCAITPATSTIALTGCPTSVNINSSSSVTFSVTAAPQTSTPLNNYSIAITGSTSSLPFTKTLNLNLQVEDFTISAAPSSVTASGGGTANYTVTTAAAGQNGFTLPVCLGVTGQPGGVTPTFNPSCISGAGSSQLSLPISSSTQAGNFPLTITGTSTAGGGTDARTVSPNPVLTVVPTISSLSLSSGVVGTSVTITGTNFGSAQNGSTLTFGGVSATNISTWSNTSIVATVPQGTPAGSDPVVVTVNNIASNNNFKITVFPAITGLSLTTGPIGTPVTLTGTSFGSTQGNSTVTFNGISAGNATSWSDTSVTVTVPQALTPGGYAVVITVNGTVSDPPGTTPPTFTVVPSITSISPPSGATDVSVTIMGTNFGSIQGSSSVTFGGTAGIPTSWTNTKIVVPVPSGLEPGPTTVVVTNVLASNAVGFGIAPGITGINPAYGPVGSLVSINGTSFGSSQGNGTVTFNGTAASVSPWSNATLTAAVPPGASTGNIVVTAGGILSSGVQFIVTAPQSFFLTTANSPVGGVMTLSTTGGSTASIGSQDLINQSAGEYLIQAFETGTGVPGSTNTWPAGLAATFTVWMSQTAGTAGSLLPEVKLYLNSQSGTPICSVTGTTALTTTNTQYNLSCAPAGNITLQSTDQYYLWVGVNSTAQSSSSLKAQVGVGIQLRGRPASNVTVPIH